MSRTTIFTLFFLPFLGALPSPAQESQQIMPVRGFLAEFINQLNNVERKIVGLAEAVPQEKFGWRPAEGVRSIGEVYLHLAGGNYFVLATAGFELPVDVRMGEDRQAWETSTTDKSQIVERLKKSFSFARQAAMKTSAEGLEKSAKLFGRQTTLRDVFLTVALHQHEHLGQSIAYARMNGIVPPWTAERMTRQKR